MVTISQQAVQQLQEFWERRGGEDSGVVRIGILSGSTTGPNLGVTIDSATEKDELFTFGALEVVVDRSLLAYCRSISVEYVSADGGGCGRGGGFKIVAENPL